MFESLTKYIELFNSHEYGKRYFESEDANNPFSGISFVDYSDTVISFIEDLYEFGRTHSEFDYINYGQTLHDAGISMEITSYKNLNISKLDMKTIFALLIASARADNISEGALLELLENDFVINCLTQLRSKEL